MNGNENPVGILCILESIHRCEPRGKMMNVEFQSIGRRLDSRIFKVMLESTLCCLHEALICMELDRIETEEIPLQVTNTVMFSDIPCMRCCLQEESRIAVEHTLLSVARRRAFVTMMQCELEARAQLPEQMHMAALLHNATSIENAPEAGKTIRCGACDSDATLRQAIQQRIVHFARLAAGTESACDQTGLDVPYQVFAEVLPLDGQGFCVHEDHTTGRSGIEKFKRVESVLHVAKNGCRTQPCSITDAAVRASVEQVHLDERIGMTEESPAFADAKSATAIFTFTTTASVTDSLCTVAMGTFFS